MKKAGEDRIGGALRGETRIRLNQAPAIIAQRYRGKKPSLSTLHRWATRGVRGVRLEIECIGRAAYTSVAAIERFIVAVSAAKTTPVVAVIEVQAVPTPAAAAVSGAATSELQRRAFRSSRSKSTQANAGITFPERSKGELQ
ncbi:MAG: DUF1580 domain-containing protein [Planctomycetaceae bacterium]